MKKFVLAVAMAAFSFIQIPAMANADVIIKFKPQKPRVKKVVVIKRQPCYYREVKTYRANKVTIVKERVCP